MDSDKQSGQDNRPQTNNGIPNRSADNRPDIPNRARRLRRPGPGHKPDQPTPKTDPQTVKAQPAPEPVVIKKDKKPTRLAKSNHRIEPVGPQPDSDAAQIGPLEDPASTITNKDKLITLLILAILIGLVALGYSTLFQPQTSPTTQPEDDFVERPFTDKKTFFISLDQDGPVIIASSDQKLTNYQYFVSSSEPSCQDGSSKTWKPALADNKTENLINGQWVCFRAHDQAKNYSYAKTQIDIKTVTIDIVQEDTNAQASSGNELTDWQYFLSSINPNCSSANQQAWSGALKGDIAQGLRSNDRWICFRAKNDKGVYSYAEIQIDLSRPPIKLTQDGTSINASSSLTLVGWQYFIANRNPNCSPTNRISWSSAGNGPSASNLSGGQWVCFRAENSRGVFGFKALQVDLNQPPIKLATNQTNASIKASSTADISQWSHIIVQGPKPDCLGDNIWWLTPKEGSLATNLNPNDWVCFQAKNNKGVYGWQISQFQPQQTVIPTRIIIDQNGATMTAHSSDKPADYQYRYLIFNDEPADCQGLDWDGATAGQTTSNMTDGQWVCFQATISGHEPIYENSQIDLKAPRISINFSSDSAQASSDEQINIWEHIIDLSVTCDESLGWDSAQSGATANGINPGQWVCFRGRNHKDVWGYANKQYLNG